MSTRRYTVVWSDDAIATGVTLNDEQRRQVTAMKRMLEEDPYRGWFFGVDGDGDRLWYLLFSEAQVIYYSPRGNIVRVNAISAKPWREFLGREDED